MTKCKKSDVLNYLDSLAEETSIEEVMEKLYFLGKVEKGIQQKDSDKVMSHEKAKTNLYKWLK